jgi:hypothetical protein
MLYFQKNITRAKYLAIIIKGFNNWTQGLYCIRDIENLSDEGDKSFKGMVTEAANIELNCERYPGGYWK